MSFWKNKPVTYFLGHEMTKANENYKKVKPLFEKGRITLDAYAHYVTEYLNAPYPLGSETKESSFALDEVIYTCLQGAAQKEGLSFSMFDPLNDATSALPYYIIETGHAMIFDNGPQKHSENGGYSYLKDAGFKTTNMNELVTQSLETEEKAINALSAFNKQQEDVLDKAAKISPSQVDDFARFACKVGMLNELTLQLVRNLKFSRMIKEESKKGAIKTYNPKIYDAALRMYSA